MKLPLQQLALAIAQQEGWFDPDPRTGPTIPHVCNNPGNLEWAPSRFPQNGHLGPYVKFPAPIWGAAALLNDVRAKMLSGLNLELAIRIYCPSGDGGNNPSQYAQNVAGWLKVDPNQKLSDLFEDPGHVVEPWHDFPDAGSRRPFISEHK